MEGHEGNQDETLSSGGFLFSGNARPMPLISLHTDDYLTVPFSNDYLEFKAGISHGWFGSRDQYVKNAFLHYKYFYLRIGEKKLPVSLSLGLQHAAMWGGYSPDSGNLPSGLSAFYSVLRAKIKDGLGPVNDSKNVLGNHLGSYSLGIDLKLNDFSVAFYWQTMLEDKNGRVGVDWRNGRDGLWGLVFNGADQRNRSLKILAEYFNSTHQSGGLNSVSGNDNYFNNYLYRSGWTYHLMTIGTPLITSPVYSDRKPSEDNYLENNSVQAFTAAVQFGYSETVVSFKTIWSLNHGTISIPFRETGKQLYAMAGLSCPLKFPGTTITFEASIDRGSFLGNNAGLLFKIRKVF
jgi:hypothetical protein